MNNQLINGKVIAITGGGAGLGFFAAQALVAQGAKVALLGRRQPALDEACEKLGATSALGFSCDVSDKQQVDAAFAKIEAHFGQLNGLINCAGIARPDRVENLIAEEVMQQININLLGTIWCSQAAIPRLRAAGGGLILNVSSATVRHDNEISHLSVYAASKAAVERFSHELRQEVKADRIGVTVFSPGAVMTEFGFGWDPAKTSAALHEWQKKGTHFDGYMKPEIIGQSIAACFGFPSGVACEYMEVKPCKVAEKPLF